MNTNDNDEYFEIDLSHTSDNNKSQLVNDKKEKDEKDRKISDYLTSLKNIDYHKFIFGNKEIVATDEQYQIITNDLKKDMLILACAGSGKSTTMVCRVKNLIDRGVDPTRIILTTFNVDACESLKKKLTELFGFIPSIMLGTFDSIACRLYYKYFKKDHFIGINEYTTELLKYLNTENGVNLIKKFEYVIFDEFQDVNETQYQVIKKFYDHGTKITLVGDDAQNIYQWRGSDIKYILRSNEYFPTIEIKYLSVNYRSSIEIVNFANAIIRCNKDNIIKPMLSYHGSCGQLPLIRHSYKLNFQSQYIVGYLSNILQSGRCKPQDIAIISRNNFPLKDIEEEIEKYNKNETDKIKYVSLITNDSSDNKPKIDNDCVTLTTIYKAKGLEWEYVFLVSCDDDTIPSNLDPIGIQEERRLFYVAVTRAKRVLQISFSKKTLTRFIGDIDERLYMFPSCNKKFFEYDNSRFHKTETELFKVVSLLNEYDIDRLRMTGVIPNIVPKIDKIHQSHIYSNEIEEKYLHNDFNNFVIRYIMRKNGEKNRNNTCFYDTHTNALISSIKVSRIAYNLYVKYFNIINKYLPTISNNDTNSVILQKLNDTTTKIDENEKNGVILLIKDILMKQHNNTDGELIVLPEKFLPEEYLDELTDEYAKYIDPINETQNILNEVYKVSLCENICCGRRRLIYQDVFQIFEKDLNCMSEFIQNTIHEHINSNIICNKRINAYQFELISNFHMLDINQQEIMEIRLSSEKECKLEWLLQMLGKIAMLKTIKNYSHLSITKIRIYNPLQGVISTFDISGWNKHLELLQYLCKIRGIGQQQILDNKQIASLIETQTNNNINKDLKCKEEHIEKVMSKDKTLMIENIVKIKNLMRKYEQIDNESEIIENKIRLLSKYTELREEMKENKNLIPKYIVFDTETTGLPGIKHGETVNKFIKTPDATKFLKQYDTARLLQLSWAVYNETGKIIKMENHLIKPNGYKVGATHIHGITENMANTGEQFINVLQKFHDDFVKVKIIVGHNIKFDVNVMISEMRRHNQPKIMDEFISLKQFCTLQEGTQIAQIPRKQGGYKYPKQCELYEKVLGKKMENAHNALFDVLNLGEIVTQMITKNLIEL
jgi:DNA polymerase III epsilon subunit-like protein